MIQKIHKPCNLLWQKGTTDEPVAEPPLLVEVYSDVISITQEGKYININRKSMPELIKLLKEAVKS